MGALSFLFSSRAIESFVSNYLWEVIGRVRERAREFVDCVELRISPYNKKN